MSETTNSSSLTSCLCQIRSPVKTFHTSCNIDNIKGIHIQTFHLVLHWYKWEICIFLWLTPNASMQSLNQRLSRACIVHLVIKKNNWSYVKTMYCSGSHLGITINIKNTKFVKDLPMIDAQFRFNQCNSFREEYISVFSPYGSVLILWPVVAAILDFRSA